MPNVTDNIYYLMSVWEPSRLDEHPWHSVCPQRQNARYRHLYQWEHHCQSPALLHGQTLRL
jgi:hypothetical protein